MAQQPTASSSSFTSPPLSSQPPPSSSSSLSQQQQQPLRILCFGDSLTSGYHTLGLGEHPYSDILAERLKSSAASSSSRSSSSSAAPEIQVVTSGVPGDLVTRPGFHRRLVNELSARRYDWVILLGGTNDLGSLVPVDDIFYSLKACWKTILDAGCKILALTVPECHARVDWLDLNRRALNLSILAHKHPKFHTFDLFQKIPYHSLSQDDRDRFWDDGLHLTADGYDWMGGHIADALLPLLQPQSKSGAHRRAAKSGDDHRMYEEEVGSPDIISQGYIVVRKRDLD